jgi:hypothetical protein
LGRNKAKREKTKMTVPILRLTCVPCLFGGFDLGVEKDSIRRRALGAVSMYSELGEEGPNTNAPGPPSCSP